ncbi:MAG: Ig domain-containing protein [Thermodesulfobacteriota bacterium]
MTRALKYPLIIALIFLLGCGGEDGGESVTTDESAPEVADEPVTETEDVPEEEPADAGYSQPSLPSLGEIKSVKINTLSANPRDGFLAVIEYDGEDIGGTGFIYDWKLNGNDITGASEEKLEWRDGFKKGDTITLSVTPYNDLGAGALSAEGSITIPNSPPVITSEPDASFEEGRFSYIVEARDPDGDPIDFSLRSAPRGMTIEPAAGLILWEYGEKDAGDYKVTVIVTDSEGAESRQELTLSIHPQQDSGAVE